MAVPGVLLLWLTPDTQVIVAAANAAPSSAVTAGSADPEALGYRQALEAIDDCLTRSDSGSAEAPRSCPELEGALIWLGLDRQLPEDWRRHLEPRTLKSLAALLRRYSAPAPSIAPALNRLPLALRNLQATAPAPLSWWQRLLHWLDQLFSPKAHNDDGWLTQLLSHLSMPRWLQQTILYLSVSAVLAMAAYVIYLELKAAGVLSRQRGRSVRPQRTDNAPKAGSTELKFDDLQLAPPNERCVWLVRLLVQALRRSGRLSRESNLTYRELAAQPVFDDPEQHARFEHLALLAERQRYGSLSLDGADWMQLLNEGHLLYSRWLASAAAAPAGASTSANA